MSSGKCVLLNTDSNNSASHSRALPLKKNIYLLWCNEEKVNAAIFPPIVGTPWCAPIKVKHGAVSCRTPRGEHYKNVMGTRCKIRCKQGYETESSEVVCMASKHWSSNYACRGENWHPSERTHIVSPHTHVCINTHIHLLFHTPAF